MSDTGGIILLVGRLLFAVFALNAGAAHVMKSGVFMGYAKSMNFPVVPITGWPTGLWIIAGGLSVGLGVWPDLGALMVLVFAVIAAGYFHRFWELGDEMQRMTQMLLFWRNTFIVGASLFMFATFVELGPALRYAITTALIEF
jgi:putative oxidoreductase